MSKVQKELPKTKKYIDIKKNLVDNFKKLSLRFIMF